MTFAVSDILSLAHWSEFGPTPTRGPCQASRGTPYRGASSTRRLQQRLARLDRIRATLASADADGLVDRGDKDLAVADPAGMRGLLDRLDRPLDQRLFHDDLDLHLRQKVDHVFGPAIKLGMAFLAAEPLGLGDRDPFDADLVKSLLHLVQLEGFDDRLDLFHRLPISFSARRTASGLGLA